jgi:hypothetical protein
MGFTTRNASMVGLIGLAMVGIGYEAGFGGFFLFGTVFILASIIVLIYIYTIKPGLNVDNDDDKESSDIEEEPTDRISSTTEKVDKWANDCVSSITKKNGEWSYCTTILSKTFGPVHGFGKTSEDSQEQAHRLYEHYKEL